MAESSETLEAPRLPFLKLDPDGLAPRSQFEALRASTRAMFELLPRGPVDESRYEMEGFLVDRLVFCRTSYSPSIYRRPQKLVDAGEGNIVALQLFERGTEYVTMGDFIQAMRPGFIYLRDWTLPFASSAGKTEQHGVIVPRELVQHLDDVITPRRPVLAIPTKSGVGAVLEHAWRSVLARLPTLPALEAPALSAQFVRLLNATLARRPRGDEVAAIGGARSELIKAYVIANAEDPSIDVGALVRRFACSRATLYRMFEDVGGVHSFLVEQRLERAFAELVRSRPGAARVHEVARRWGFDDPGHFHRRFRARFECTPGEILRSANERSIEDQNAEQIARHMDGWLRAL